MTSECVRTVNLVERYGRKTSKNAVLPYRVGFDEAQLFSQVEIKKLAVF